MNGVAVFASRPVASAGAVGPFHARIYTYMRLSWRDMAPGPGRLRGIRPWDPSVRPPIPAPVISCLRVASVRPFLSRSSIEPSLTCRRFFPLCVQAPSKKKVAAVPAAVRKPAGEQKETNPLFEKRPRSFGIGGNLPPKKDMHRFVKWPKYVRIQRQRRVLKMRLKVPPALNRFTKTLDKASAETVFKLLMKYRPEDKSSKKERLLKEAEARSAGKEVEKKKPVVVKFGINHVTTLIEQGKAQLVVIAHDVDPIEMVIWLPVLCKKMGIPYVLVKGKARLGTVVHQKTATCLALTSVKSEDERELAKIVDTSKSMYLDAPRVQWGGGIMGPKSQMKTAKRERQLAKELGAQPR